MKELNIGIIGFGTVGTGTIEIITTNSEMIEKTLGFPINIKKICVKSMDKTRTIEVSTDILTTDVEDIILDKDIDIVVEVMGGIERSKDVIERALKSKKHVVTANKDLISLYGKELTDLAVENNCHLLYEASVAGGIPILNSLQFSLSANHIKKISGIINGSTNYILTRMEVEKLSLERIIDDAMRLGFLEADPSADLDGYDASRKCAILASVSFHSLVTSDQVYISGIRNIALEDIEYAKQFGYKIKLLAVAQDLGDSVVARVHPALIPLSHPLSSVKYEFNAVYVDCDMLGETMFYGRGAGSLPTGSAVVGDIIKIGEYLRDNGAVRPGYNLYREKKIMPMDDMIFSYYLRVNIGGIDESVVDVIKILEKNGVSMSNLNKREKHQIEQNEYVIITNECREADFQRAYSEISKLENVLDTPNMIRIERGM